MYEDFFCQYFIKIVSHKLYIYHKISIFKKLILREFNEKTLLNTLKFTSMAAGSPKVGGSVRPPQFAAQARS